MADFPVFFHAVLQDEYDEELLSKNISWERTEHGSTALHFAALGGHINTVSYLLEHNFDPNQANYYGETPLHWATKNGDRSIVDLLLNHRADPTLTDADGNLPLHWAAEYDESELAALYVSFGVSLSARNEEGRTPHQVARDNAASAVTRRLLRPQKLSIFRRIRDLYEDFQREFV